MDDKEKSEKNFSKADFEAEKREKVENFESLIKQLKTQQDGVNTEINREYREMRRYVQANPEEGVLLSFLGGIALGYLLGKLGD